MENKSFKDTFLRGIALLGLILILVLGAWGIIVLAFNIPNFLSSAGTTIAGLFEGDRDEETVEVPVVSTSTPTTPSAPTGPTTSGKTTTASPKTTSAYSYTPAPQPAAQLYGLPDLAVRIISVVPQPAPTYASGGNRYSMQFEVSNMGTNIAGYGWAFTAQLPMNPTYTYNSGPQQALRPGDKIVYTMGFDMPYQGYDYNRDYNDDERYDDCNENYDRWDLDEWEDWYEDVFDRSIGSRDDWDEGDWEEWYDDFCDDRDGYYDYDNYSYYGGNRVVSVTADPFGAVYELNRFNNTASQTIQHNYYPTYPTYPTYPQYPWVY